MINVARQLSDRLKPENTERSINLISVLSDLTGNNMKTIVISNKTKTTKAILSEVATNSVVREHYTTSCRLVLIADWLDGKKAYFISNN